MISRFIQVICCLLSTAGLGFAQLDGYEKHIEVAMRMIGHEVLLLSGDSSSRVLPIEKQQGQYHIQFESGFPFDPDELAVTVNRVISESGITDHYIVEVEHCETGQVVYSYEMSLLTDSSIVPCKGRVMPEDCYSLVLTLFGSNPPRDTSASVMNSVPDSPNSRTNPKTYFALALLSIPALLIGLLAVQRKKRNASQGNPNIIAIGEYQYDTRNMELRFGTQTEELTGKEAELLLFLYQGANTTIDRTDILKAVWGDEGDYVGRTLDVFISKLRKKLEADSRIKIVNVRGVGYKLVVDV